MGAQPPLVNRFRDRPIGARLFDGIGEADDPAAEYR
jgi:hypothetical protein